MTVHLYDLSARENPQGSDSLGVQFSHANEMTPKVHLFESTDRTQTPCRHARTRALDDPFTNPVGVFALSLPSHDQSREES